MFSLCINMDKKCRSFVDSVSFFKIFSEFRRYVDETKMKMKPKNETETKMKPSSCGGVFAAFLELFSQKT